MWISLLPVGCHRQDDAIENGDSAQLVVQRHETDEIHLTLTCDKSQARVAELILLDFTVEHPADVRVIWPPIEGGWGGFALTPQASETDKDEKQSMARTTKRYALRSLQSGEKTIPELTLRFTTAADSDTPETDLSEITTHPIDIEIISALSGTEEPETVLQAEANPVELPEERVFPWEYAAMGAATVVLLGAAGYGFLRWLRDRRPPPVVIPAHRWALDALDRLASSGLIERGDVHEYYFRLSGIVRGYIERRFGILAPEMTTEEFVDTMRSDRTLDEGHRRSLGPFLESCDLVKFARYVPGRGEVESAFSNARSFIIDTADYGETETKPTVRPERSTEQAA